MKKKGKNCKPHSRGDKGIMQKEEIKEEKEGKMKGKRRIREGKTRDMKKMGKEEEKKKRENEVKK